MEFEMLKNELRINGEEKYEPVSMSIVKETLQVLVITNQEFMNYFMNLTR